MRTIHPLFGEALQRLCLALFALVTLGMPAHVRAASVTWSGSTDTTFGTSTNWLGGATPTNDTATDIAVFAGTVTANQPQLTASRSIAGLSFTSALGGWTLSSSTSSNVLTIGANGVSSAGPNTISASVEIGAAQTWLVNSAAKLTVTGNLTSTSGLASAANFWTFGNSSNKGTVVLNPSGANSITLLASATTNGLLYVNYGQLVLGGNGSTYGDRTTSSNSITNNGGVGLSIAANNGGSLQVNSGSWTFNDLGKLAGQVDLNGGSFITGGARNFAAGGTIFNVNNGGTFKVTGLKERFALGNNLSSGQTATMNVDSGGFVDVATNSAGINYMGAGLAATTGTALLNQKGGVVQMGVTSGTGSNKDLQLGYIGNSSSSVAYTLSGGTLLIAGKLNGITVATGTGRNNFNFLGGTLTTGSVDATNFGYSSTASASTNQVADSTAVGTLTNAGGTLAPGGSIVNQSTNAYGDVSLSFTPTSGKTGILGQYTQQAGGTLAINISGTTASSGFQDAVNSGKYSNMSVSGTSTLSGTLAVNLISGTSGSVYSPASTGSFTILSSGTIALAGFANTVSNVNGETKVAPSGGAADAFLSAFKLTNTGTTLVLSNYAQNEWIGDGTGNWGTANLWSNGVVSTGSGMGAKFSASGTANTSITLDVDRSIGQMIFGNANYSISGAKTLTLNNGASAATITVNSNSPSIGTAVALNSDLSITGSSGAQITLSGNVSESGGTRALTLAAGNASKVILSGSNSYTGATTVNSGTLQIGNGGESGSLSTASAITNNGALVFNRSNTISQGTDFSGSAITGTGSVTQSGNGALVLSGSNGYSGGTNLASGTLVINNANSLGAASGNLTFSGPSTLRADATLTTSRNYSLNAAATIDTNGNDLTNNGALSGTGTLTKAGSGTLSLGGTNTYSGATAITGGVLEIGGAGQLGSSGTYSGAIANDGILRLASSANQTFGGIISGTGDFTRAGTGATVLTAANTYTGATIISSGTLQIGNSGTTGALSTNSTITNNGALVFKRSNAVVQGTDFSGTAITGNGSLTQSGSGSLTLTAANSYTGPTTISSGTLQIGNGGTTGSLSTSSAITNNGRLVFNRSDAVVQGTDFSGSAITGSGSLTQSGSGSLTLTAANTYTGATTIGSGTLQIGNGGTTGSLSTSSGISNSGALVFNRSDAVVQGTDFSGSAITGTGSLTQSGAGLLILTVANTYTGATTIGSGTLQIGNSGTTGSLATTSTIVNNGTLVFNRSNTVTQGTDFSSSITGVGSLEKNGSGALALTANSFSGGVVLKSGSLRLGNSAALGTGTLSLMGGVISSNSTTPYTLANNVLFGGDVGIGDVTNTGGLTFSKAFDLGGVSRSLTINSAVSVTGTVSNGGITKYGSGVLTLSSSNNFAGGINLQAGVLRIANASALGSGTFTLTGGTMSSNSTTAYNMGNALLVNGDAGLGDATNTGALTFNGNVDLGGLTRTLAVNSAVTLSGAVSNGGIIKNGAGTLILSGSSSAAGDITVNSGTLQIGAGGTTGSLSINSAITNNGTLVFNRSNTVTQGTDFGGSAIAGTGSITQSGNGALVLSSSNSYSGGTTITGGILAINNAYSLGASSGALTFGGASTLRADATLTTARNYVLNAAATIDTNGYDLTNNGVLSGTNALTKAGVGTLSLGGTNTYSGATSISAGTLEISAAGQLGSTGTYAGAISNSGILRVATSANQTLSGVISGAGDLVKAGAGTLTLTGANTYSGKTTVSGGTLFINSDARLGATPGTFVSDELTLNGGALAVANSFTLSGSRGITLGASGGTIDSGSGGDLTVNGAISGAGSLTKTGVGILRLGLNSFTGGFVLNDGALRPTQSSTVVSGTVTSGPVGTGTFTINGGRILPGGAPGLYANQYVINGDFAVNSGAYGSANFGLLAFSGPIDLANGTRTVSLAGYTTAANVISGSNSMRFTTTTGLSPSLRSGTLRLVRDAAGGASDFAGFNFNLVTTFYAGTGLVVGENVITYIGQSNPFGSASADLPNLSVESGGYFNMSDSINGRSVQVRTLSGAGVVTSLANSVTTGTSTLTINPQNGDSATFSGRIVDGNSLNATLGTSANNVCVALAKSGSGTQTLSGLSTYTGATAVTAGKLIVSGSLAGTTSVNVSSGAELKVNGYINNSAAIALAGTLSGSGTVGNVTVQSGGILAPGNSPGTLTTGSFALVSGGAYNLELNSTTGSAGTNWDQVVASTLDLTQLSSTNKFTLSIKSLTPSNASGLLDGFDPASTYTWAGVIQYSSLAGSFNSNLFTIDTTGFLNPFDGSFSLAQNGNQIDLQYMAIPEPSILGSVLSGLGMLLVFQRSRRRRL